MKAYEPYELFEPKHPEEFKNLKFYLESHGKLNIRDSTLENFYYDFCDEQFSAGWIDTNSMIYDGTSYGISILELFALWLEDKEL